MGASYVPSQIADIIGLTSALAGKASATVEPFGAVWAAGQVGQIALVPITRTGVIQASEISTSGVAGSAVVDVKYISAANLNANGASTATSIAASAKPTLTSARLSRDTTLTGWSKNVTKGDYLVLILSSATTLVDVRCFVEVL